MFIVKVQVISKYARTLERLPGFTEIMALGWEPHFPGLAPTLVPELYKSTFSQTDTLVL